MSDQETRDKIETLFAILEQIAPTASSGEFAFRSNSILRHVAVALLEDPYFVIDTNSAVTISNIDISDYHLTVVFRRMNRNGPATYFRYEFTSNYSDTSIGLRIVYVRGNRTSIDLLNTRLYQRALPEDYGKWRDAQLKNGWVNKTIDGVKIPEDYLEFTNMYTQIYTRFMCFADCVELDHGARITNMPLVNIYDDTRFCIMS